MTLSLTKTRQQILATGHQWLRDIAALPYPPLCALTREPINEGEFSHNARNELLRFSAGNACWRCGSTVGPYLITNPVGCDLCQKSRLQFERTLRLGLYEAELAAACRRLKHVSGYRLAVALGNLLAEKCEAQLREMVVDAVVPVPLHWWTEWQRRYNPSEVIAAQIARQLDRPLIKRAILRQRRTPPQHHLSMSERQTNVRGAFKPGRDQRVKGARILLVDDVMTTGATCHESARALKDAGAASVCVAILARGGPRRDFDVNASSVEYGGTAGTRESSV